MDRQISSGLKLVFLAHFIVGAVVGVQHLLAPRFWTDLAGMEISETVTWRVIGAALIGFAVSSWLAYREEAWNRVRIIVVMEIVWSVLGALVIAWGIFFEDLAALEWMNLAILACFAAAFGFFFVQHEISSDFGRAMETERGHSGVGKEALEES